MDRHGAQCMLWSFESWRGYSRADRLTNEVLPQLLSSVRNMASHSHLQSLYHPPRNTRDPRVAATTASGRKKGDDGKLYTMTSQNDYEKYRTLTDEEMEEEERMNREMAQSLNMKDGKMDAQGNTRVKNASAFVPPHLGTSNRTRKIEKRAWEKKIASAEADLDNGESGTGVVNGDDIKGDPGLSSEDRLMDAVAAMQEKYTENMSVIEQLFSEKKQMETRMAALEEELQRTKREQGRSEGMRRKVQAKDRLNQTAPGLAQGRGMDLDYGDDDKAGEGHARTVPASRAPRPFSASSGQRGPVDDLIADDLCEEPFDDDDDDDIAAPAYVDSPPRRGRARDDAATSSTERVSAADMASLFAEEPLRGMNYRGTGARGRSNDARWGVRDSGGSVRRSQSLTRKSAAGLSSSLQADTDRYLQKRNLIREKEKREKEEQEKYELQLKEKFMRASHTGKQFVSMERRAQEAEAIRKERMNRKYEKARAEEAERQEKERLEKTRTAQFKKGYTGKTWQELQREDEAKRKDRVEQRKMQMSAMAAYPSTMAESVENWTTKKKTKAEDPPPAALSSRSFVAQNPEEVAAQLKRKQENWERKMEREREKLKAVQSCTEPVKAVLEMEKRERLYAEKAKERADRQKKKEEDEKAQEEAKRRKSMEKLLNAKVPEASRRLTKAVECKAKAVQAWKTKSEADEKRERDLQKKKERNLQETSNFLKSLVRKSKGSMTAEEKEQDLQARVKASAEQFKANRLANKKKIQKVLATRPSLIERQDQAVVKATAGTAALGKVANAFIAGKTARGGESKQDAWQDLAREEDFLDETEKIKLGLRDKSLRNDLDEFA